MAPTPRQGSRKSRAVRPKQRTGRPVARFIVRFLLAMIALEALWLVPPVRLHAFPAYLQVSARASAALLRAMGEPAEAAGTRVFSPRFAIEVRRGCDAIEPSVLFVAGLLAFPVSWRAKWPAALVGPAILAVLNLVRIVSLFLIGAYRPDLFDATHVEVWQIAFVFLTMLLWLAWLRWATRRTLELSHAQATHA